VAGSATAGPAAPRSPARAPGAPRARKGREPSGQQQKDYIIAYDGAFLGHYRSQRRITNRTAFARIAQRLEECVEGFDISRLEIYRPVPVKVERPDSVSDILDGSFNWFGAPPAPVGGTANPAS
jgi:hypothetical protein